MSVKYFRTALFLTAVLLVSSSYADWKSDANARIESLRKRNAEITIVDSNGQPVQDVGIQIDQTKHRFAFGTCLAFSPLLSDGNYGNFVLDHFEWAVCENETKWPSNEPSQDSENYSQADYIYDWCSSNGINMRGHCLFWEQLTYVQSWVQGLDYAEYPASSDLLTQVDQRIDSAVNHFKDKFKHWDVDNEMLNNSFYDRLGEAGRVHMFQYANIVDPNCKLFMNEYNGNSFGGYDASGYISRCSSLRAAGAPIGGLGIQGHVSPTFSPQNYWTSVLKPLGTLGLPILVTEYDYSEPNVNLRADGMENFYRICFSDPNVIGILMWGFWQDSMWRSDAYIVNSDWTLNAAGQRYESLLDEWTTYDDNTTNSAGKANFRGFHGTYELTLTKAGEPNEVHTIELEPGSTTQQFTIQTNFQAGLPDTNAPIPNPLVWISPPAATGKTAITMTAATASDSSKPLQYYFKCTTDDSKSSGWQSGTTYIATGLTPGTLYSFKVKARDNAVAKNETDWSSTESAITNQPDISPPTPNPLVWASLPAPTGPYTITMTAVTASDNSPPVQYYFECTTDANKTSSWQTSTTYTAGGLNPSTLYSFRVKARDSDPNQNETGWSDTQSATTWPSDFTPPTPNPITWALPPAAAGPTTIRMTATTAIDDNNPPVQYYFECTTDAGKSHTWQTSPTYIATGLTPATPYMFRVKARDSSPSLNETAWSIAQSAATKPPIEDVGIIGSWAAGTTHSKESGDYRALLFIAHAEKASTITNLSSVTYGGQAMTKIIDKSVTSQNTYSYVAAFMLNEAGIAAATDGTFAPAWSALPENIAYASAFLSNVNQTVPVGPNDSNSTAVGTQYTITTNPLATNEGDMVIIAASDGQPAGYTVNNGFTEDLDQEMSSSTGVVGHKSATGVPETPSVTISPNSNRQVIIGFTVQILSTGTPPAAPTGLSAAAGNGIVTLDWNDNNEAGLAGYNIYRSTTSYGGYGKLNVSLLSDSNYTDNNINNGTTYYYAITAVDANGNMSGFSDEASARPNYDNCAQLHAAGHGFTSDLNGDCYVDWQDLEIMVDYWLNTNCGSLNNCQGADFTPINGIVDFADFSNFAKEWMQCNNPQDANCIFN